MILGPLGVTWYMAYRRAKDGANVSSNRSHQLAKNFILHWSIFLWLFPAWLLLVATFIVGTGYVLIGLLGILMGSGFLFFFYWFAAWIGPLVIALITLLATKLRSSSGVPGSKDLD